MKFFQLTLTLLLTFSVGGIAFAQKPKTKAQIETIEGRSLCYARSAKAPTLLIQGANKKQAVKVTLPLESISHSFKCISIDNKAVFYKNGKVDKNGKPVPIPLAIATIPKPKTTDTSERKFLFYFIPNKPGAKLAYRVKVFADDYSSFPLGHTRVINLSSTTGRFAIGEHRAVLKANSTKDFPAVTRKDKFNMGVFRYAVRSKKQWLTIRDRTAKYTTTKRLLVIACYDPTLKRPDVRIYKDIPPAVLP